MKALLCKIGIGVGLGNYLLYALLLYLGGGDALHGHVSHGHYYLAADGTFVEISRAAFLFCKYQAYTLLVTFPLGLLAAGLLSPVSQDSAEAQISGGHGNARLSTHAR